MVEAVVAAVPVEAVEVLPARRVTATAGPALGMMLDFQVLNTFLTIDSEHEKQAAHGWGAETGEAELADEQAGEAIAKKEEKPKNLGEETRRFWGSITDRYYEFGKRESREREHERSECECEVSAR